MAGKRSKKRKIELVGAWTAVGSALLISYIAPVISYGGFQVITKTGIWWFPLIIGFFVVAGIPSVCMYGKREKENIHMQAGDELFYSDYPGELRKRLNKARKAGIPERVQRTAVYYRARPVKSTEFSPRTEKKRQFKIALLYVGAGITALLGIFLIWRAFPIPEDIFKQEIKTADFTPLFLLAAGILTLSSAVGQFLRKALWPLRSATIVMLVLSIWSAGIAYTLRKLPTVTDCIIHAVCFTIFLIVAIAIPLIAGDTRTAEQIHRDRRELRINLFELGLIDEEELRRFCE